MIQVHHQNLQADLHYLYCHPPNQDRLRHHLQGLFLMTQVHPHQYPIHHQDLSLMTLSHLHPLEALWIFELYHQQTNSRHLLDYLLDCLFYPLSNHLDPQDHRHQNLCYLSDHLSYRPHQDCCCCYWMPCCYFLMNHLHLSSYRPHPDLPCCRSDLLHLHQTGLSQLSHPNPHHLMTFQGLQKDHYRNHCPDQLLNFQDFWNHMIQHPMYYQILPNDHSENFQCYLSNQLFFQVLLNCLFHQFSLIH